MLKQVQTPAPHAAVVPLNNTHLPSRSSPGGETKIRCRWPLALCDLQSQRTSSCGFLLSLVRVPVSTSRLLCLINRQVFGLRVTLIHCVTSSWLDCIFKHPISKLSNKSWDSHTCRGTQFNPLQTLYRKTLFCAAGELRTMTSSWSVYGESFTNAWTHKGPTGEKLKSVLRPIALWNVNCLQRF